MRPGKGPVPRATSLEACPGGPSAEKVPSPRGVAAPPPVVFVGPQAQQATPSKAGPTMPERTSRGRVRTPRDECTPGAQVTCPRRLMQCGIASRFRGTEPFHAGVRTRRPSSAGAWHAAGARVNSAPKESMCAAWERGTWRGAARRVREAASPVLRPLLCHVCHGRLRADDRPTAAPGNYAPARSCYAFSLMVFAAMKMAQLKATLTTDERMDEKSMPAPPTRPKATLMTVMTRFMIART